MKRASGGVGKTFIAMVFDMRFGRFGGVMRGVMKVTMRGMGMVRRFFMMSGLVVLGSFFVVEGRFLVMFRGLAMMFRSLLRHKFSPLLELNREFERIARGTLFQES